MYKQLLLLSILGSCSFAAGTPEYISGQTDPKSKIAKQKLEQRPGLFAGGRKIASACLDLCWKDRGKVGKAIFATALVAFLLNEARLYRNNEFGYCFVTNWFFKKYKLNEYYEKSTQSLCEVYNQACKAQQAYQYVPRAQDESHHDDGVGARGVAAHGLGGGAFVRGQRSEARAFSRFGMGVPPSVPAPGIHELVGLRQQ